MLHSSTMWWRTIVATVALQASANVALGQPVSTQSPASICANEFAPTPSATESHIFDIAVRGPNDVFALGSRNLLRFDGQAWRILQPIVDRPATSAQSVTYTHVWIVGREVWVGSMFSWNGERGQHCWGSCNQECSRAPTVPMQVQLLARVSGSRLVPVAVPRSAAGMISEITYGEAVMRVRSVDRNTVWVITNLRILEMVGARFRREIPLNVAAHLAPEPTATPPAPMPASYVVLKQLLAGNGDSWSLIETPLGNLIAHARRERTRVFAPSGWATGDTYVRTPSGRLLSTRAQRSQADGTNDLVEMTPHGPMQTRRHLGGFVEGLVAGIDEMWSLTESKSVLLRIDSEAERTLERIALPRASGFHDDIKIVASGRNEVWVVGYFGMIRHVVDGHVEDVDMGRQSVVRDAWFLAPDDGYLVGSFLDTTAPRRWRPRMMHWDGHAWTDFALPNSPYVHELTSVAGTGHDDIWIVSQLTGADYGTLLAHWDGAAWSLHEFHHELGSSVMPLARNDVWWTARDAGGPRYHFDGRCWMRQPWPTNETGPALSEVDPSTLSLEYVGARRGSVVQRPFTRR